MVQVGLDGCPPLGYRARFEHRPEGQTGAAEAAANVKRQSQVYGGRSAELLDARIIREVQYRVWVANVVMVPKKNGNIRMCIDFTELNKACLKDPYPLPRIDIIIDQVAVCEMLSLLDCFSGYHQVWMRREDEAKTGFTTPFGIFYFIRMPEGLRNA
jgi:hypothetical protein